MTGDPPVVVMGVSASGKSTIAEALAARRNAAYVDADRLHPPANIRKMSSGVPLDDDDRWPWLDEVGTQLGAGDRERGVVVACSALRRTYRDRLRLAAPDAVFVQLHGDRDALMRRAGERQGHFMPAHLIDSQLATLEPIQADEQGMVIDIETPIPAAIDLISAWLDSRRR